MQPRTQAYYLLATCVLCRSETEQQYVGTRARRRISHHLAIAHTCSSIRPRCTTWKTTNKTKKYTNHGSRLPQIRIQCLHSCKFLSANYKIARQPQKKKLGSFKEIKGKNPKKQPTTSLQLPPCQQLVSLQRTTCTRGFTQVRSNRYATIQAARNIDENIQGCYTPCLFLPLIFGQ